jgi:hypothetical protein
MSSITRAKNPRNQPSYAYEASASGFHGAEESTIPLWRYMDFTKFVSMLESRSLYFSRTDLLGDDFEGSLTRAEAEERDRFESRLRKQGRPLVLHRSVGPKVRSEVQNSIVSCWHMNEYESMAMWRLYLTGTEGISVRSTFGNLAASFPQFDGREKGNNEDMTEKELRINIGVVHYVDFDGQVPLDVPRILLKRKSFEHEREVRAVAKDRSWGNSPTFDEDGQPRTRFGRGGDYVPVDLERLIDAVYVSPDAQPWFAELVEAVVHRYDLTCPVQQSDLAKDPVF